MDKLPFVLWMIGWPLSNTVDTWICEKLLGRTYTDGIKAFSAVVSLAIWLIVGSICLV